MILLIDNYDSFSYNLYQLIGGIIEEKGVGNVYDLIKVVRNDELTVDEIEEMKPSHIILSPGPKAPKDAGICIDVVKKFAGIIPIFGVCLGHQSICVALGASIGYADTLMHGKQSVIDIDTNSKIFRGLDSKVKVGRYHSLAIKEDDIFPEELKVIARTDKQEIMAVEYINSTNNCGVYGVQFHPESILTDCGKTMLTNFLDLE